MDRRTDGRTDGRDYNIPFAFLKKRGDKHPECMVRDNAYVKDFYTNAYVDSS